MLIGHAKAYLSWGGEEARMLSTTGGEVEVKGSDLYKGDYKVNGDNDLVDALGKICDGHVTIFLGDTRVATTVKDQGGARAVGTKCSEKVANQVLKEGKFFVGEANVLGEDFQSAYEPIKDSKGQIIDGTRGKKDENGVFTAKVEVDGVKKDGFSSFYPEDWSPQDVVDAINTAYKDALADKQNPRGSLWIGHAGKLEIDMYLDDHKKILTAYPIHRGK